MLALYHAVLLKPIFNTLVALYNLTGDVGIAIVLLTLFVRLIIFPITVQSLKSQKALQGLQPKLNALKDKFKNDKQGLAKATMELYKAEKVNPASSCLPLFIQLPVFIALYQAMRIGLGNKGMDLLYTFTHHPETIHTVAFGFLNLLTPSIPLAVLAGLSQFWQAKMMSRQKPAANIAGSKDESMLATMNTQMLYVMPVMTVVIGISLPGGLILYWLVTNLLTIAQQYVFFRPKTSASNP